MNNFDKKAKWDNVKEDVEAIEFHASRYLIGQRDTLAVFSFQTLKQKEQDLAKKND